MTMANVVRNPSTPYVGPIPMQMTEGVTIHVRGTAESDHKEFVISLQCGISRGLRNDIALWFNPRFHENVVVRNSLKKYVGWGTEERNGSFPFRHGANVDISIVANAKQYTVKVDGRHFCDYYHRIPLQRVRHIAVEHGFRIQEIVFEASYSHHPNSASAAASGHQTVEVLADKKAVIELCIEHEKVFCKELDDAIHNLEVHATVVDRLKIEMQSCKMPEENKRLQKLLTKKEGKVELLKQYQENVEAWPM